MFSWWKLMKPGICEAEAGSSYLRPCLKDMDLSSLRTITAVSIGLIKWQQKQTRVQVRLTLVLFHAPTLEALVQQTNAQTDVNAHALFVDLPCKAVLDKDVGRICA